jgi:GTPase
MANIRVLASLEKTASDMNKIHEQVVAYSGVDLKDAARAQAACDEISKLAKEINRVAQKVRDNHHRKHWNDPDFDPNF